ncbi:MAG: hypothetical protein P8Z35_05515, partial [Ignavibacteriaceae bacterium]
KIIVSILISCMLLQLQFTQIGCTSFYPVNDNNKLVEYNNYSGKILLKLKDKTELNINPKYSIFIDKPSDLIYGTGSEFNYKDRKSFDFKGIIEKDAIDSGKVIESNSTAYHLYWTRNNRRLSFKVGKVFSIAPDSGSGFWLVFDNNRDEYKKIYDRDIAEIQVQKTNWVTTSILILLGIGVLALFIAAGSISGLGGSWGGGIGHL